MITAKPTEHLAGITLEGEYSDFYEIVESIYRMTGLEENYDDRYWSVKNRLLGICYDIRHAYMGDRTITLANNGVHDEMMKWTSMILPKQNVHYSVEVMFPEAVFVALSVPEMYVWSAIYYGDRARKLKKKNPDREMITQKYGDYLRDKAVLDTLCSVILSALAEVIGDEELEKLLHLKDLHSYGNAFEHYAAQYVDKCNVEYLKTVPEKRKDKLRNIAKRLANKPSAYDHMKWDLEDTARAHHCSIHQLRDPSLEYPEEIEW